MDASRISCDVYTGNIREQVDSYLIDRFGDSAKQMPVVSSINLAKKTVNSKATVYRNEPERTFTGVTEAQEDELARIYKEIQFNSKMMLCNRYYELQKQTHAYIIPKNGKLVARALKSHQLNVVPSDTDTETGEIYILSSYDIVNRISDNMDQTIGDEDDDNSQYERYIVWSPSYHFIMDGRGTILSVDGEGNAIVDNPIAPVIPIVEIAMDKDFEYWTQDSNEVTDFTIEFNGALSSLGHICDLQGFSQAYLRGPQELLPTSITVGPTHVLRLATDSVSGEGVEFGFASPSSDLAGAQSYVESLLSMFLSSQGVDPKAVTGSAQANNFSSGIERLLAMVSEFEASKDVMAMFKAAEVDTFEVIKAWLNLAMQSDILTDDFKIGVIPEDASISINFKEPNSSITDNEVLANIEKKIDLGLMSRTEAIAELRNIEVTQAEEIVEQIDNEGMDASEVPTEFSQPEEN